MHFGHISLLAPTRTKH